METAVAHTLGVGQLSPFEPVGPGGMALAVGTNMGQLTMILQLPGVTPTDIEAFRLPLQAIGWMPTGTNPVGALALILAERNNSDYAWPLTAPVIGMPSMLQRWAEEDREDNCLLMVMVDSNTNTIAALRVQGLPVDLIVQMRLMARLNARTIDIGQVLAEFNRLGPEQVWQKARKWRLDPATEQHIEEPA